MENQQPAGEAQNSQKKGWYQRPRNLWLCIIGLIVLMALIMRSAQNLFMTLILISLVCFIISWGVPQFFYNLFGQKSKVLPRAIFGIGIIVFFVAFGVTSNTPNTTAPATQSASSNQAPQTAVDTSTPNNATPQNPPAQPATPPSEQDQIKQLVSKQLEGKNNNGKDYVKSIDVIAAGDGGWTVVTEFNAGDNLTSNMQKQGIEMKMSDIYSALYTSGKNILIASVAAYFPLQDKYGNTSDGMVYRSMLKKPEADKVNWKADKSLLDLDILPKVWDTTFLNKSFQN